MTGTRTFTYWPGRKMTASVASSEKAIMISESLSTNEGVRDTADPGSCRLATTRDPVARSAPNALMETSPDYH